MLNSGKTVLLITGVQIHRVKEHHDDEDYMIVVVDDEIQVKIVTSQNDKR